MRRGHLIVAADEDESDDKQEMLEKVKNKMKDKEDTASEIDAMLNGDSADETPGSDKTPESDQDAGDSDAVVDEIDSIVEDKPKEDEADLPPETKEDAREYLEDGYVAIPEDDVVTKRDMFEMFDRVIDMVSTLLRVNPPRDKKKKASVDSCVDKALAYVRISNRLVTGAKGQQVRRKDVDLMSDTGGTSKGRQRDPNLKPPRDDMKKPYNTKKKTPSDMDPDTDLDPDKKKERDD